MRHVIRIGELVPFTQSLPRIGAGLNNALDENTISIIKNIQTRQRSYPSNQNWFKTLTRRKPLTNFGPLFLLTISLSKWIYWRIKIAQFTEIFPRISSNYTATSVWKIITEVHKIHYLYIKVLLIYATNNSNFLNFDTFVYLNFNFTLVYIFEHILSFAHI